MKDTTSRGDLAELEVAAALVRDGKRLLRPLSSASRYDLAIDNEDGTFTRVQCKTGILRDGRVAFRLYSISGHTTRPSANAGQVDAFGVYCPQTDSTYLIPMAAISEQRSMACLRVEPARNGQVKGIRPASEFLIGAASHRTDALATHRPISNDLSAE